MALLPVPDEVVVVDIAVGVAGEEAMALAKVPDGRLVHSSPLASVRTVTIADSLIFLILTGVPLFLLLHLEVGIPVLLAGQMAAGGLRYWAQRLKTKWPIYRSKSRPKDRKMGMPTLARVVILNLTRPRQKPEARVHHFRLLRPQATGKTPIYRLNNNHSVSRPRMIFLS